MASFSVRTRSNTDKIVDCPTQSAGLRQYFLARNLYARNRHIQNEPDQEVGGDKVFKRKTGTRR